jgi:hypothetical protein
MTEKPEPGEVPPPDEDAAQSQEGSRVLRDLDDDQNAAEAPGVPDDEE